MSDFKWNGKPRHSKQSVIDLIAELIMEDDEAEMWRFGVTYHYHRINHYEPPDKTELVYQNALAYRIMAALKKNGYTTVSQSQIDHYMTLFGANQWETT